MGVDQTHTPTHFDHHRTASSHSPFVGTHMHHPRLWLHNKSHSLFPILPKHTAREAIVFGEGRVFPARRVSWEAEWKARSPKKSMEQRRERLTPRQDAVCLASPSAVWALRATQGSSAGHDRRLTPLFSLSLSLLQLTGRQRGYWLGNPRLAKRVLGVSPHRYFAGCHY